MTHANAPLTPEGRRRLAELDRRGGLDGSSCCRAVPGLAGHGCEVGRPVSRRPADDRLLSRPRRSPTRCPQAAGAADREAALLPPMGSAPDQLPPRRPALDGRTGAGPLPDAAAGPPRPGHRPAGPQAQAGALRGRRPGELVHVDIKKLGRIPDGGGWRVFGRGSARTVARRRDRPGSRAGAPLARLRLPAPRRRRPLPAGLLRAARPTSARRPPRRSGYAPERSSPTPGSASPR